MTYKVRTGAVRWSKPHQQGDDKDGQAEGLAGRGEDDGEEYRVKV